MLHAHTVCNLAFPDSNCALNGDVNFCFRLRHTQPHTSSHSITPDTSLLFGYVHFRQQRDDTNARGYLQQSVVCITPLPCVTLMERVVTSVAMAWYRVGNEAFSAAVEEIRQGWVQPVAGETSCGVCDMDVMCLCMCCRMCTMDRGA